MCGTVSDMADQTPFRATVALEPEHLERVDRIVEALQQHPVLGGLGASRSKVVRVAFLVGLQQLEQHGLPAAEGMLRSEED